MGWKLKQKQTDNSFLGDKIALRLKNIPEKSILRVLDAFSGFGTIWKNVQKRYPGKIIITSIDKQQKNDSFVLLGDNIKYLESLNLSCFDVIDLDAYSVPCEQLKILFRKKYHGVVFITFIQVVMGALPHEFLFDLGYSKKMIEKCPTLFFNNGLQKIMDFLSINGVTKIKYRFVDRKNYICFSTN